MGTAHVLGDTSVLDRLNQKIDDITVLSVSDFGGGLWLLLVETPQLPEGYWHAREIVTWDTCGFVPAKLKVWVEL